MRIAITGAGGQLGHELCRRLGPEAYALPRPMLDITDRAQVFARVQQLSPDIIINCAAYTFVDRAEAEPDRCMATNADAVGSLATACDKVGAKLVQISTDYVFGADSQRSRPYDESDQPGPQGIYAKSKLAGELYASGCTRHLIVRSCGLYGYSRARNNFVDTMLRLGSEGGRLRVVNDQCCSPTFTTHLANAIHFLVMIDATGLYHVTNSGHVSWYQFARKIFEIRGMPVPVEPISTADYGAVAPRPRYSVLDTSKYRSLGGPEMPQWEDALAEYLQSQPLPQQVPDATTR